MAATTETLAARRARPADAAWPGWFRLWLFALVAISLVFVLNDALVALQQGRTDLAINCLARVVTLGVATLAIARTRGDRNVKLLVPGLIGVSFDVHWQTAYFDAPGMFAIAMAVKFVGVSVGLTYLLRLTARFGGGRFDAVRSKIDALAPAIATLLAVVGLAHGALEIATCRLYDGRCIFPPDRALDLTRDAYLLLDALIRVAMIVATAIGVFTSWAECRERLFFMMLGALAFAAGTAIHFTADLLHRSSSAIALIDAVLTASFPVLLFWAAKKRQLFDVEYAAVHISLIGVFGTIAAYGIVLVDRIVDRLIDEMPTVMLAALDQAAHFLSVLRLEPAATSLAEHHRVSEFVMKAILDVGLGLVLFLLFRPIEERLNGWVHRKFPSTRGDRIDALRRLCEEIGDMTDPAKLAEAVVTTIHQQGRAAFALLFGRHADGRFLPLAASPGPPPPPFGEDVPLVHALVAERKPLRLKEAEPALAGAKLAVPMLLGGTLYGIVACGRKASAHEAELDYDPDEEKALCSVARAAAGTLLALHVLE